MTPSSPGADEPPRCEVVILNERAGSVVASSPEEVTGRIVEGFEAKGVTAPRVEVCPPGQLAQRLTAEVERGTKWLVVGGGDGTVATAAGLLRDSPVSLGVLPMGTFNLFARDLGMPLDLAEAAGALATAESELIDVAEVNGRPYLCVCVLGFFPEVALRRDRYRGLPWWRKALAMMHAMLRSFTDYPSLQLSLMSDEADIDDLSLSTRFIAIANNRYEDEPGVIPRKRSLSEGHLAAYISRHRSIFQLIKGSLAFVSGSLTQDPRLSVHTARTLRIQTRRRRQLRLMLDGEIVKVDAPLDFQVRPGSLRVLKPVPHPHPPLHSNRTPGADA